MNSINQNEPKTILQKAWYEPRHFFFWLGLFSPFVYAMVLLIAAMGSQLPAGLQWPALAAILGFLIAVPAFALSWIPPIRRLFARLLHHKLLGLGCIVTLVALFYAVENWRGRHSWNKFQREWQAKGVGFSEEDIVPANIPDSQNMFAALPWEYLRFSSSNGVISWKFEDRDAKPWLDNYGPKYREAPEVGSLIEGKRIDLAAWQDFYRGSNNLFSAKDQPATNFFPVALTPQSPADDVLLALTKYATTLDQVREAARRPGARFWINYEDGFGCLLPHLAKLKAPAQYLRLRAAALLADGQTDAALTDTLLAFRISDSLREEPLLISQLVRLAMVQINLLPVWDGLVDHRWTDAQLAELDQALAKIDFLADYQTGMGGERYFSAWTMDFLRRTGDWSLLGMTEEKVPQTFGDQLLAASGKILFRLAPTGWLDQNKLSLGRMHVDYIRPMVDVEKQLVLPAQSRHVTEAIETKSLRPTPYNLFSGMLLPALDRAAQHCARGQTYVNLTRVAIALERYRLANGNYPETLAVLSPKYLPAVPHDVINGKPLRYRRTEDGNFLLYSVGWNETDDGGVVAMTSGKQPTVDRYKGDWVWRFPTE